jgi:hypothetical protein
MLSYPPDDEELDDEDIYSLPCGLCHGRTENEGFVDGHDCVYCSECYDLLRRAGF